MGDRTAVQRAGLACLLALGVGVAALPARSALPARLADPAFWAMTVEFSEAGGFFRSDNLVSNEDTYQAVIPELQAAVRPGGVYIGVGPDQNFTYIAAVRPKIAFIPDIRRGNLQVHLMYKALFELSDSRAAFLSRLFSRPRPRGLAASAPVERIFAAIDAERPDREMLAATRRAVVDRLKRQHGFPLDARDEDGIGYVLEAFSTAGPEISYSNTPSGRGRYPTFRDLHLVSDGAGVARSYLASEAQYRFVRDLQQRNLIVPLVGNFAGSKTLRAAGDYVRAHGASVTAFYTSNVEQYLFEDGLWGSFAENVAALPLDQTSTIIRSCFNNNCATSERSRSSVLLDPIASLLGDLEAGKIGSYSDVLAWRR